MGVWVVVLEAVAGEEPGPGIDADDLDAFADALADYYPVVAGTPSSYEAEIWVEENTAGGAMLEAQRLWQIAAREAGIPLWDVVRGEARDARALDSGRLAWADAPGELAQPGQATEAEAAPAEPEPAPEPPPPAARAAKKSARKSTKKSAPAAKRVAPPGKKAAPAAKKARPPRKATAPEARRRGRNP